MRALIFSLLLVMLYSCKEKCAECHKHDSSGAVLNEFEVCEKKKKEYDKAIEAAEADGYECHAELN